MNNLLARREEQGLLERRSQEVLLTEQGHRGTVAMVRAHRLARPS